MLICPPGTERLDITVDKWAVEQNWQDAWEDKMTSVSFSPLSVITAGQQRVKIPEFTYSIIVFRQQFLCQAHLYQIHICCAFIVFSVYRHYQLFV